MAVPSSNKLIALAVGAHPDDIEFQFAGTLLLLKKAGCEIHMWNLANGCLGSMEFDPVETARIRWGEAQESAALAEATIHPSLFHDLEIFFDKSSLAKVASVIRSIRPQIILTHSPQDYMEDHQNTARLVVTAAFSRGIPHFQADPPSPVYQDPVRIYHGAPHGLCDGLETPFQPNWLVDISSVLELKQRMLSCHRSQKEWLEASQGMGAYVAEMTSMCRTMALKGVGMEYAEGWRRHSHLGFCASNFDPLQHLLGGRVQQIKHD